MNSVAKQKQTTTRLQWYRFGIKWSSSFKTWWIARDTPPRGKKRKIINKINLAGKTEI